MCCNKLLTQSNYIAIYQIWAVYVQLQHVFSYVTPKMLSPTSQESKLHCCCLVQFNAVINKMCLIKLLNELTLVNQTEQRLNNHCMACFHIGITYLHNTLQIFLTQSFIHHLYVQFLPVLVIQLKPTVTVSQGSC